MADTRDYKAMNRKRHQASPSEVQLGKIPPQARELEQAVLGALLIERDAVNEVADFMSPEVFYVDSHATIFKAIQTLSANGQPIDMLTVIEQLRTMGKLEECGGAYYISELTNMIASSANIVNHARIIVQRYMGRRIIEVCNSAMNDAYEDTVDIFELLEETQSTLSSLEERTIKKDFSHIGQTIAQNVQDIETFRLSGSEIIGVPVNIKPIDKYFNGFRSGDFIVVAARPSMGKTALAISFLHGAASLGIPSAFCSLEMPEKQIQQRLIAIESGIDLEKISSALYSDAERDVIFEAASQIKKLPIFIDDQPAISLIELRAKARRLIRRYGIKILIVDYLQLMRSGEKGLPREQEISTISRGLKALAKELDIPVIALAQLSRSIEQRGGDKKPLLSDLRESGAIEQDADIVMFPHRPEYYGQTEDGMGNSTRGMAQLIIAKYRNGATGEITEGLGFKKKQAMFYHVSEYEVIDREEFSHNQYGKGDLF